MFLLLILLFTVIPVLELAVIIKVGQAIGVFKTIGLVLAIAIIGGYLARLQGFLVLQKIQLDLQRGMIPTSEMLDGLIIFCGGVLLLTPGFITDIFGLILLFPTTRWFIKRLLRWKFETMLKNGQVVTLTRGRRFRKFD